MGAGTGTPLGAVGVKAAKLCMEQEQIGKRKKGGPPLAFGSVR